MTKYQLKSAEGRTFAMSGARFQISGSLELPGGHVSFLAGDDLAFAESVLGETFELVPPYQSHGLSWSKVTVTELNLGGRQQHPCAGYMGV